MYERSELELAEIAYDSLFYCMHCAFTSLDTHETIFIFLSMNLSWFCCTLGFITFFPASSSLPSLVCVCLLLLFFRFCLSRDKNIISDYGICNASPVSCTSEKMLYLSDSVLFRFVDFLRSCIGLCLFVFFVFLPRIRALSLVGKATS